MPYNNTPIAPPAEVSGSVSLPLARVQKIINADPERLHTSKNAAFAIALATEMFIQHLATTTHNVVKTERKPRRNIQYRDVATAVAKTDNLEFLVDVVPKTTTYKEFKKRQEEKSVLKEKEKGKARGNGQMTLAAGGIAIVANGSSAKTTEPDANGHAKEDVDEEVEEVEDTEVNEVDDTSEAMEVDEVEEQERASSEPSEDMAAKQIEMEMRGPRTNGRSPEVRRTSGFTAINGSK
ncbi:histone-fold-containing protein [Melanomma pulvis-pyrius CBS 109.77]|uniref:Histone-fold-containing protein n=1 Tax=Melanomma pulvis-pyrius CBS 109.77 TaxID=1314802 RepID=A0A6A6X3T6_9PLEO|nr:histone-fold-containing protein [Melanomma pulvis-pyrius CBS 109.77]